MGEEQKETESTEQEEKKEEAAEEKKEEEPSEIVLKVDMHCEGCARKVEKSLRKFEGVEEVKTDSKSNTVVVKGKTADPVKVCERVQKKTGKKVELISPLPKPPEEKEEEKKEENKEAEEEKKEEPKSITVILKVRMHCEACAQHLQKRIRKMEGVESVVTDLSNDQVIVKGIIDPGVLVEKVYRRTRKQATIVQDEEKKEEEKKPEEEEKKEENKEEEKKEGDEGDEAKKYEHWPYRYPVEYAYTPQEEKKPEEEEKKEENKKEEKKEGEEGDDGDEAKKYEHWPYRYPVEYAYTPHVFSDENPNACLVM